MMPRPPIRDGVLLAALLGLAACTAGPEFPATRPNQAAMRDCRSTADRVFDARNRYLMSERDQRDTPFSTTGMAGVTSQGLGQRDYRDQLVTDCLRDRNAAAGRSGVDSGGGIGAFPAANSAGPR